MKKVLVQKAMKTISDLNTAVYRASGGRVGGKLGRVPVALLTTTGRKSGKPRTVPLLYVKDGDKVVFIASKGGWQTHPLWYLNLVAEPDVEVQIDTERFRMRARTAEGEERERYWAQAAAVWKDYDNYQKKTDRQIPVVVCEPR